MTLEYLANIAIGYLLGSIPFGLLAGYAFIGKDIRRFGSGKTGTTNVLRTAGKFAAHYTPDIAVRAEFFGAQVYREMTARPAKIVKERLAQWGARYTAGE